MIFMTHDLWNLIFRVKLKMKQMSYDANSDTYL